MLLLITCACNGEKKEEATTKDSVAQLQQPVKKTVKKTNEKTAKKLKDKDSKRPHIHSIHPDTLVVEVDSTITDSLPQVTDSMQLRILSIGNSFSRDAFSYVPFILNELMPGLDLKITIMYYPGRPLKDQWAAFQSGASEYQRDTYTTQQGAWVTEKQKPLPAELDSLKQWDLIVFQQGSGSSPRYETYQPFLHNLTQTVRANVPGAKIGWLLTPAHPDGYAHMPTETSHDMWELICDATEQAHADENFDIVFPGGTAVQNARQTPLDSLGIFGHMSADGLHLQDGIPCLIEAYTIAQKLFNYFKLPFSITLSTLHPTQQWAVSRHIPEMNGTVLEGSDEDYALCKRIAIRAIAKPYSLFVNQENITPDPPVKREEVVE